MKIIRHFKFPSACFKWLCLAFVFSQSLLLQGQKIVGYTPSWSGSASAIDYDRLTHINYAFAIPTASGALEPLENPAKLQAIVTQAHSKGVKVLIAVGGWDLGDGGGNDSRFNTLASTAAGRTNFTNSVISLIDQYNLDGADIDWEFPEPVNGAPDNNFTLLMQELSNALHSRGLLLTAAVNGSEWAGDGIAAQVFGYVDFLNIMAYDGDAGAGHSPYSYAESALNYYKGRGLPAAKAVIGVPFYARPSWKAYSTLLAEGADPYADYFNGDYYNGINTIKAKTALAKTQGGGIMIWTIDHDVQGEYSLLKAIKDEMGGTISNGVLTLYEHCNYDGYSVSLNEGSYNLSQLQALGVANDDISSLQIQSGYEVTMYQHHDFTGNTITKSASDGCLVDDGFNDDISSLVISQVSSGFSTQIEAENYAVMNGVQTEACSEGGQNVGWIDAGDWMVWDVNLPSSGTYNVQYRVASLNGGGTIQLENAGGSPVYGSIGVPNTGGWQNWTTISHNVNLNGGQQQIAIYVPAGGYNINWLRISSGSGARMAEEMELMAETEILLYPNPVHDKLNIKLSKDEQVKTMQLYDLSGKVVQTWKTKGVEQPALDVSKVKAGQYILKLKTNLKDHTFRILKE